MIEPNVVEVWERRLPEGGLPSEAADADRRQKAKAGAANDGAGSSAEAESEGGDDMFSRAGVAAE